MLKSIQSLAEILTDSEGPFGLSADLVINAVTEAGGVVISILISIFFAVWLDRRFDRTRRTKQVRFLHSQLRHAYIQLSNDIPNNVSKLAEENRSAAAYGYFYIHTKRMNEDIRQLIDNLLSSYGLDIDPTCVTAINEIKFNIRRLFDIADMETSVSLREAIANDGLEDEAQLLQDKYCERLGIIKENIKVLERNLSVPRSSELPPPAGPTLEALSALVSYSVQEYHG